MERELKVRIREEFISRYGGQISAESKEFEKHVQQGLEQLLSRRKEMSEDEKKSAVREILSEFVGLGPIEEFMQDPTVTEIMINGPSNVYIERNGKKLLTDVTFDDEQHLKRAINRMLSATRRHVDESNAYVDVALKDGSRVNIIIPPLALNGPVVTIRKFLKDLRTVDDLIEKGTMDRRMAEFLVAAIQSKLNIIFSGASGAGKTTTANVLSSYINDERIVTIEDTAELMLPQEHVVRLEARQPSIEGKGEVSIRELFRNSLRMRADRVIVGEVRGAEALDMLQAMCAGQNGSLAILHASSPWHVIYRLETMILTTFSNMTAEMIYRQIASALHLIVHQEQLRDGSRRITHITQVRGMEAGEILLDDIFAYDMQGISPSGEVIGRWRASGIIPTFYPTMIRSGIALPQEIFQRD